MARKSTAAKAAPDPVSEAASAGDLAHDTKNTPPDVQFDSMLDDLELEAQNWLDGEPLSSQDQADQVTRLVDAAARLEKDIEATRKAEKEPHLEAGKAVDAKFKPLNERAQKIVKIAKRALTPWLEAVEAEKRRVQLEREREAREAEERLREAHRASVQSADFAGEELVAQAEEEAKAAKKAVSAVKKEPVVTRGGSTIVKLRDVWLVNIENPTALLKHYMTGRPDELKSWLYEQARKDVRGGARSLPGCSIWSEKKAV